MLIKKEYLLSLIKALQYDTTPQKFRAKRKVLEPLEKFYLQLEEDRINICTNLCDKKEDGTPALNEEGNFTFTDKERAEQFIKEINELTNETVDIESTKEELEHFVFDLSTIKLTDEENILLAKAIENLV